MATEINTEQAKFAFNKYKAEKVKMLIDFGEANAANRLDREMSERDFVAGWVLALDHLGLLPSASAVSDHTVSVVDAGSKEGAL